MVLDPQFLADLMSTIVTFSHRYAAKGSLNNLKISTWSLVISQYFEGFLFASDLRQIWKKYESKLASPNPLLNEKFLDILAIFETIFPISEDLASQFIGGVTPNSFSALSSRSNPSLSNFDLSIGSNSQSSATADEESAKFPTGPSERDANAGKGKEEDIEIEIQRDDNSNRRLSPLPPPPPSSLSPLPLSLTPSHTPSHSSLPLSSLTSHFPDTHGNEGEVCDLKIPIYDSSSSLSPAPSPSPSPSPSLVPAPSPSPSSIFSPSDQSQSPQSLSTAYIVPFLLPESRPPYADVFMEEVTKYPSIPFGRVFVFDFLPIGFFGRLLVRILHWGVTPRVVWRHGIGVSLGTERAMVICRPQIMTLEVLVFRQTSSVTPSSSDRKSVLLRVLLDCVTQLQEGWFSRIFYCTFVPCLHCMNLDLNLRGKVRLSDFESFDSVTMDQGKTAGKNRMSHVRDRMSSNLDLECETPVLYRDDLDLAQSNFEYFSKSSKIDEEDVALPHFFPIGEIVQAISEGKPYVFCLRDGRWGVRVSSSLSLSHSLLSAVYLHLSICCNQIFLSLTYFLSFLSHTHTHGSSITWLPIWHFPIWTRKSFRVRRSKSLR